MAERDPFSFSSGEVLPSQTVDTEALDAFLNDEEPTPIKPGPKPVPPTDKSSSKKPVPKTPIEEVEEEKEQQEEENNSVDELDQFLGETEDEDEEEKPVVAEKPAPKKEEPKPAEADDQGGLFNAFSKELLNLGVFSQDEDEEGNPIAFPEITSGEQFLATMQGEVRKQAENTIHKFLESAGPEYYDAFVQIFQNKVDPREYYSRQARIEDIEGFDISDEANQERIVRQLYKDQGLAAEKVDARINKHKQYGDLEEIATDAKELLTNKEKAELVRIGQEKQAQLQQRQQQKNQYTQNVGSILNDKLKEKSFDGIPLEKKTADDVYNYLTKEKYVTKDQLPLTEFDKDIYDLAKPENHALKVKVALLMKILKTDPTLSTLERKAVTKQSNKLFSTIQKQYGKKSPSPVRDTDDTSGPSFW